MQKETSEIGAKSAETSMLPKAYLCHRTVDRLRVRIPERRQDEAYLSMVKEALEQHASVIEVQTTPITGSVLVIHSGDWADLLEHAERAGLFQSTQEHRPRPTIAHWLDRLDEFDREFLFARMERHPQRAATGLFMLAVLQGVRGSIIPSAPSLLGEAMRLLRQARTRPKSERNPTRAGST